MDDPFVRCQDLRLNNFAGQFEFLIFTPLEMPRLTNSISNKQNEEAWGEIKNFLDFSTRNI